MDWFLDGLKRYAQFSGRAGRRAYWHFFGLYLLVSVLLVLVDGIAFGGPGPDTGITFAGGPLSALFSLATLVPTLAVGARRLHDIGKSGWLQLITLLPFVGWLVLLWWFVRAGDAQPNAYGPVPPAHPD